MNQIQILTEGDASLLVVFGNEISPEINHRITAAVQLLKNSQTEGIVDLIPSYTALLINYNPEIIRYGELKTRLEKLLSQEIKTEKRHGRVVEIPVLYGGEGGPDLHTIAEHAHMTEQEVIDLHSSKDYLIYMIGFLPGFCYLGGLDERLHTPRLANPRLKIREGSVGIGGSATGIYPMESPGGWQLMGLTPVKTYDPSRAVPILLNAGEYIRFIPIDEAEYNRIKEEVAAGTYRCVVRDKEVE